MTILVGHAEIEHVDVDPRRHAPADRLVDQHPDRLATGRRRRRIPHPLLRQLVIRHDHVGIARPPPVLLLDVGEHRDDVGEVILPRVHEHDEGDSAIGLRGLRCSGPQALCGRWLGSSRAWPRRRLIVSPRRVIAGSLKPGRTARGPEIERERDEHSKLQRPCPRRRAHSPGMCERSQLLRSEPARRSRRRAQNSRAELLGSAASGLAQGTTDDWAGRLRDWSERVATRSQLVLRSVGVHGCSRLTGTMHKRLPSWTEQPRPISTTRRRRSSKSGGLRPSRRSALGFLALLGLGALWRWRTARSVGQGAADVARPCNPFAEPGVLSMDLEDSENTIWRPFDAACPPSHLLPAVQVQGSMRSIAERTGDPQLRHRRHASSVAMAGQSDCRTSGCLRIAHPRLACERPQPL